ncbi:hypothetical protein BDR04DRAFT_1116440 [Suillus decipiens]|nr:hypothetical protein BDR04DRAFT_1116440 [Suillus decipiens]
MSLQRSGIIISAALQVMHPDLYWARMETQVRLGKWAARYELDEMHYHLQCWTSVFNVVSIICNRRSPPHRDPKCRPAAFDIMTTAEEGNQIVTAWYMQDSIHNFVGTPSTEYAKYDRVNI